MTIICPNPKCKFPVYLSEAEILTAAAKLNNKRRKVHGGGRPRGYRKCPKCGKFHQPKEKCNE